MGYRQERCTGCCRTTSNTYNRNRKHRPITFLTGKKPRKASVKPSTSQKQDNRWKAIYKQAYFDWQLNKLGASSIEQIGYVQITSYPNVSTHKGFELAVENYVKWKGGHAQNTPTTGTPRFKQSMVGGKMVKEMQGYNRAKGGKGKQDIDATINGINVKLELKCAGDEQKPEQKKYQERIEASKGFYIILRSMFELFTVVDMCNAGQSLKGVKFHDK